MTRPATVFKYEPFTLRAIQNLKASAVYFGSPASFNDPYDCAVTASILDASPEELKALKEEAVHGDMFPPEARELIATISIEEFEQRVRNGALQVIDKIREDFVRNRGVTCFSESNDNLLLWSHYGGRYKGFCLEFRTDIEPFNKLRRVNYVEQMPQFKLSDFIRNENHARILELFCTKSAEWTYEKEWRALHEVAGTLFSYSREALKAIYFGPDIATQDRDLLCLIMYGQFPDAEMWIGKRSAAAFRVEFEKVDGYMPYAEARRRGHTL